MHAAHMRLALCIWHLMILRAENRTFCALRRSEFDSCIECLDRNRKTVTLVHSHISDPTGFRRIGVGGPDATLPA